MNSDKWLVIINPVSGAGKGKRLYPKVLRELDRIGIEYDHEVTGQEGHATQLAKEGIERGYRKLIMVGGDGTVNEVINGVLQQQVVPSREVAIGMVGIGTGNDWIRTMKIPRDITRAVEVIKKGNTRSIDAGIATSNYEDGARDRFFVNVAGMAFDASVVHTANAGKGQGGKWTYTMAVVRSLFKYKPVRIKLQVDDEMIADEIIFNLNVGNCKYSGGGMKIVPDAEPDDGLFHITFIRNLSKWQVAKNIINLFDGSYVKHPMVSMVTGKKVKVMSEEPVFVEVEGELLGSTPIEISILPNSLMVLVP